ncbi:MAG: hypothetical protein A3K16_04550 [Omnitrophica bacterium RIFCSPLOWO2_01_FULL_45_24]|nr:MAG: hypothetical protein A3C51_02075 [Omnitrophica bacterium RIFCSPHIGHO2_02_FULL_46_20]OGW93552.1 MAG: hypothetical protein A3K16_04550 [Omnitrophica bacterium RIFCSPLOWO2_01_FULL_45_24]
MWLIQDDTCAVILTLTFKHIRFAQCKLREGKKDEAILIIIIHFVEISRGNFARFFYNKKGHHSS